MVGVKRSERCGDESVVNGAAQQGSGTRHSFRAQVAATPGEAATYARQQIPAAQHQLGGTDEKEPDMSEISTAPAQTLSQAMCLGCGSIRVAKSRYLGRGTRTLRCEVCQQATDHAAVNWDGLDLREEANRKQTRGETEAQRELDALLQLFRSCNIDVTVSDADAATPEAEPQGALVDIVRWVEPEGYQVRVGSGLSVADQVYCLDWAWKSIRPTVARWHRCPIEIDLDGELFQRIYNNGRELGIFPTA